MSIKNDEIKSMRQLNVLLFGSAAEAAGCNSIAVVAYRPNSISLPSSKGKLNGDDEECATFITSRNLLDLLQHACCDSAVEMKKVAGQKTLRENDDADFHDENLSNPTELTKKYSLMKFDETTDTWQLFIPLKAASWREILQTSAVAVNLEYVPADEPLSIKVADEVAIIPPISGG